MAYSKVPSTNSEKFNTFLELKNSYLIAVENLLNITKINPQSRLEKYKKELNRLIEFTDYKSIVDGFYKDEKLRAAFIEAHEVIQVSDFLTKYLQNQSLSERNISKLQDGVFSYTEAKSTDFSRDTFFEFLIASRLSKVGIDVDLSTITDIVADFDGYKFYIECKRVTSESKYEARLKEGFRQLNKRFTKGKTKEVGIVFISATSILNPNLAFIKALNSEDLSKNSELLCENLANKYLKNWFPQEKKILCFYTHLVAPFFNEKKGFPYFRNVNYFRSFFDVGLDGKPVNSVISPRNKYFDIFTKFHSTFSKKVNLV